MSITVYGNASIDFVNPATLTPLFTAEWTTCAYPTSDIYASTPRYLYYGLLVAVFFAQWHSWLANVFLGVVSTYAGTAAIESFVLLARDTKIPEAQNVTIPYIDTASVAGNSTLSAITNLITDTDIIQIQPAAIDFDVDAVLAITVTGYLMMLPFHCWSSAVRASRARQLLILLWNLLMLGGTICALVLWQLSWQDSLQYRFCYPDILDGPAVTADGDWQPSVWHGSWNATVWDTFSNFTNVLSMNQNCLYPCFNTSEVMRRSSSLQALTDGHKSPRTRYSLLFAGVGPIENSVFLDSRLAQLMVTAVVVTTVLMVVLLLFMQPGLRRLTRVPIAEPKAVLFKARKELFHVLWKEFIHCAHTISRFLWRPLSIYTEMRTMTQRSIWRQAWMVIRFWMDILAILVLLFAMIITPVTIVVFIVWIETYIHRDLVSQETPQQVGQWSTAVSVALILISALVLQLKYVIAPEKEVKHEIEEAEKHLEKLKALAERKKLLKGKLERMEMAQRKRVSSVAATARHEVEGRPDLPEHSHPIVVQPVYGPTLSPMHMMTPSDLGPDPLRDMYTQTSPISTTSRFAPVRWDRKKTHGD